ncbi:MAG: ATP-dependent DNA ligase [Candidatus Woesearchaeota archaeon]|nr:MAG: ATP-dependent DNA ligase [Candidatus Woesearchaeota archaeon]
MDYIELAKTYEELEKNSSRLSKTYILAKFFEKTKKENIEHLTYLLQGLVFPIWDDRKLGFSNQLALKAISQAYGISPEKVENEWKKLGDLGTVAEIFAKNKKQKTLFSKKLDTEKVFKNLRELATLEGQGTVNKKLSLVAELLTSSNPLEAKYIIRTILNQLRIGIGEGTLRDGIVWAYLPKLEKISSEGYDKLKQGKKKKISSINEIDYNVDILDTDDEKTAREIYNYFIDKVQNKYDLCNDFSLITSKISQKGIKGLDEIKLQVGLPIQVMLPIRIEKIEEAFEALGNKIQLEDKLDGFRVQIHYNGKEFKLFTRNLENVTKQFAELIPILKDNIKGNNYIVDTEVIGYNPKTKKYVPFQFISQRIKRKYDIEKISKEIPVEIQAFDVIYYNGKSLMQEPLSERRKSLEKTITPSKLKIKCTDILVTDSKEKAEKFYKDKLKKGLEGAVIKKPDSIYTPGRYVAGWVKIKPVLETLDLVIVKAEWGNGKRSNWLTSYTLACQKNEEFLEIGKASTGLKEKKEEGLSFEEMTKILKPLIIKEKGKEAIIKPAIIIEVAFEEIQKSPSYSSGYATRFPRIKRIRWDKSLEDVSDINLVNKIYDFQRGKKK